jgi:excisionase family DNA binding protein
MTEDAELGAMTVKEFCRKYRIGTTKFYEEVKAGRLRAVKCGTRTLILNRDGISWERTLLAICPTQASPAGPALPVSLASGVTC